MFKRLFVGIGRPVSNVGVPSHAVDIRRVVYLLGRLEELLVSLWHNNTCLVQYVLSVEKHRTIPIGRYSVVVSLHLVQRLH